MNVKNKTCLFCLKQRQILVDDSCTAKAIQKIYSVTLPSDECRICIECHFNIGRIREFKQSIDRCSDFEVDSCFVCKSENTVSEPGVDRVVDYLLKQCTTIDIGNTDTVRACTTCLYLLEICIKYEKLARNYANCQRFCKQFRTIQDCNVALGKIDLDTLGDICASFEGIRRRGKKGKKRGRGSWGSRDENTSKRAKKEDGSVMPVMLTKLTPTMTPPGRPGKKSLSPDSSSSKKGKAKPNSKIFIKLPTLRKQHGKKHRAKRVTYEAPHSPSINIPRDPSVDDLNRIFSVELRPLSVRIEHVDLSSYLNRTISHDKTTRHPRKSKKEEFIGLDEEDVVELQQNNTSISSVGKRKSILVTERIESPNSAKKKVKFSDSPSIKYVDKLNFSDEDENESEDQKDADYQGSKPAKKKSPKSQNGDGETPENGKPRRGRPKKVKDVSSEDEKKDVDATKDESVDFCEKKEDKTDTGSTNAEANETDEKNKNPSTIEGNNSERQPEKHKVTEEAVLENGNANEKEEHEKINESLQSVEAAISSLDADLIEAAPEDASMDTTEEQEQPPMAVDEARKEDETNTAEMADEEMKDKSPEDVEMTESRSSQEVPDDIEMKEASTAEVVANHINELAENEKEHVPQESATAEFEASDREDEIEQVKQCLTNILGEQISDSEPSQTGDQSSQEEEKVESMPNEKSEPEAEKLQEETPLNAELKPEPESFQIDQSPPPPPPTSVPETPEKKDQTYSSLDDVDDISDDDDILDQLEDGDEVQQNNRKLSPDLPPLGEDSL